MCSYCACSTLRAHEGLGTSAMSQCHNLAQNVRPRTKARLSFSGGPHAPVNMADSMEEVDVGGKSIAGNGTLAALLYATFSQILEVLREFHRLFGSRNSPTTGIPHTILFVRAIANTFFTAFLLLLLQKNVNCSSNI